MDYVFNGDECVFARKGDIFEPSKGGKGYVHFYGDGKYSAVPANMVENSPFFDVIEEDTCGCDLMEDFREDVLEELREMRKSFFGKRSLEKIDELIEFVDSYDCSCDYED